MKILFLILCPVLLLAGEFEDIEALFNKGRFKECGAALAGVLGSSGSTLSAEQRRKLTAMQEYLASRDPDQVAGIVKKARDLAGRRGWLTADLLNHSARLIRQAESWKSAGIPEYQELSDAASKLLSQVKDSGDPAIAVKSVFLQTRNCNLNGEYQEPIRLIRELLRLYYPADKRSSGSMPAGAVELYILLGEQYTGIGARSNSMRGKTENFAQGANCYLRAVRNMPEKHRRFDDICRRLHYCRATLHLLGYDLRLPPIIGKQPPMTLRFVDEMLKEKRYQDVILALEQESAPELKIRYALALAVLGQTEKAVEIVQDAALPVKEPYFVLKMAHHTLALGKKKEALTLLKRYLALAPRGPDSFAAAQNCTRLLLEQKNYDEAARLFHRLAEQSENAEQRENFFFRAAQCMYQTGKYKETIVLLNQVSPSVDQQLFLAHAKIKNRDAAGALVLLNRLLSDKKLAHKQRYMLMKPAISCAVASNDPSAIPRMVEFLTRYPQAEESVDYAKYLLAEYGKGTVDPSRYEFLGKWCVKNRLEHRECVPILLKCSAGITDEASKERLLRELLKRRGFSAKELVALIKHLPSPSLKREFLLRYKKPFENTPDVCELYWTLALLEMERHHYSDVLTYTGFLLSQSEVFRYRDSKRLQALAYAHLRREEEARAAFQELLLQKLPPEQQREIVLELSKSWERSGNPKKALATAWTAVPLDGTFTVPDRIILLELLQTIIRNGEKIRSSVDVKDARNMLQRLK